jgi:DNA-binding MarR family transcriptional regulator
MRELALRVRELIVAGDRYRQAVAAALGVGIPEAVTLSHLYHAGQLTPTGIAERLGMTTASVTGLLDRLSASGYLTRSPNPRDRRSVLVTLTAPGRRDLRALCELFATDIEEALSGADPAQRAGLAALLDGAIAALQDRAAHPDKLAALLTAARAGTPAEELPESADSPENSAT